MEGSHAAISAQLAQDVRRDASRSCHAIEAHHYEVQPQTVEAMLVIAADAISASRPGARGESLENYIKRLENLEQIASAKQGVEQVYALQAGREIRVMVKPTEVDDDDGRAPVPRDRPRDRGAARVPGPDQGDGHPRDAARSSSRSSRGSAALESATLAPLAARAHRFWYRESASLAAPRRSEPSSTARWTRPGYGDRVQLVKRYHVTTFGCQMNAHDSERIKGMLESLGLGEAVGAGRGRRARLQHVHDPREAGPAASPRTSRRRGRSRRPTPSG